MRDDRDFAAYLAARWSTVVRTLVLLGGPPDRADAVARTAFARCSTRWGRLRTSQDLEVEVYATVLGCWAGRPWVEPPAPAPPRGALEVRLDRLTPDARAALVLGSVAGLSAHQVAQVLDRHRESDPSQEHDPEQEHELRRSADAIAVGNPPLDEVLVEAHAHRRRRLRRATASVVAVAVVVGAGAWLGTRPAPQRTDPEAASVARAENPSGTDWWANGVLHLAHVTVELPRLDDLFTVPGGAVYGDAEGGVFLVADDGTRELLGRTVPGAAVQVSDEQGWAAWVDVRAGTPALVVHDLSADRVLGSRAVAPGSTAVAIDQSTVYYSTPAGTSAWLLPGESTHSGPLGLLDVSAAAWVRRSGPDRIEFGQAFPGESFVRSGVGAELSPDGEHVLTRVPDEESTYGTVHVYDTRSGAEVRTGLSDIELAVDARLGPGRTVTYVVARAGDKPRAGEFVRLSFAGPLELRTCSLDTARCVVEAKFPSTGSAPLLAH